ncbi:hypothetical protein AYJ57_20885 (plasmid) [Salipiger sp. CCB-MM3]|uniref:hypothetical protein n=1 Tax=Salipiger sp. CCB-MM3 TaxID=1792508 RepID=UPI00080AB714|nr:hypothetical protein [Salipiger sp. CCB-MM3]ANT62936.1 hypothetical protein AYJ57_20885 [Salipiger sp. CCB-MM3]
MTATATNTPNVSSSNSLTDALRRFGRRMMISRELTALSSIPPHLVDRDVIASRQKALRDEFQAL